MSANDSKALIYHSVHPIRRLQQWLRLESEDSWVVVIYTAATGLISLVVPIAVQAVVNTIAFGTLLQPLAVLTVMANYYRGEAGDSRFSPFLPLVLLAVPLYDLTSVTLIRLARGKSPFVGDTNHFSHRLAALGLSRRAAVLTIYLATAATALGSLMLRHATTVEAVLVFAQTLCSVAVIAVFERIAGERVLKE